MTTREKQLVRESYYAVRDSAGALSLLFYGRLFELEPKLRPMFHGDIARQGMKVMQTLNTVVESLGNFEALTPTLHAMGQRHSAYGVESRQYELVGKALVWSLGQALTLPADSDVLAAWRVLIEDVSTAMIEGADRLNRCIASVKEP